MLELKDQNSTGSHYASVNRCTTDVINTRYIRYHQSPKLIYFEYALNTNRSKPQSSTCLCHRRIDQNVSLHKTRSRASLIGSLLEPQRLTDQVLMTIIYHTMVGKYIKHLDSDHVVYCIESI